MTTPRTLSRFEVLDKLRREIKRDGSLRATARRFGCSPAYLSDTLKGKRDPGPKLLGPIGLVRLSPGEQRYQKA